MEMSGNFTQNALTFFLKSAEAGKDSLKITFFPG